MCHFVPSSSWLLTWAHAARVLPPHLQDVGLAPLQIRHQLGDGVDPAAAGVASLHPLHKNRTLDLHVVVLYHLKKKPP